MKKRVSGIGCVVTAIAILILVGPAESQPRRPPRLEIGPGDVNITQPYDATIVVIHNGTVIHTSQPKVSIKADTIRWEGSVTFALDGANGTDAGSCTAQCRAWCMAMDHNNWEKEWNNAKPEDGERGPHGGNGQNGADLVIAASNNEFVQGSFITIQSRGGKGGRGGAGCLGACFGLTPSGDDCRHGTKSQGHKDGNRGPEGYPGGDGKGGEIYISTVSGRSKFKIDAGQVHWN